MSYTEIDEIKKAQTGDNEIFEKILEDNNGLIWSIVKKFVGKGYETQDLYQIGCIGFIKAVKRFDISYNYKLSTFAVPYIFGEIKKFIRDDGMIKVSRNIKELSIKIREIENEYISKTLEIPNTKIIAELLNVKEDEVIMALDSRQQIESINSDLYENGNSQKIEQILPKEDEQSIIIEKLTVQEMMDSLAERDKKIINLRFFCEKTQSQVAKMLGISQVQVSRLERKILNEMKCELVCI